MSKADLVEAPTLTRREQETALWKESLQSYIDEMDSGWDGVLERGDPLEQWVQRQRKHFRNGVLLPWKVEALKAAGFKFVAPRVGAVPTDQEYAQQLVKFHRANGHYAPTQTHGGAGLTKWLMRLRAKAKESGNGLPVGESACEAVEILLREIPGFMLYGPGKAEINSMKGLTFNGFKKSTGPVPRARVLDESMQASLAFAEGYAKFNLASASRENFAGFLMLIERARWFKQALGVKSLGFDGDKDSDQSIWWLSDAKLIVREWPERGGGIELLAEKLTQTAAGGKEFKKWLIKTVHSPRYLGQGELYGFRIQSSKGDQLEVAYDVVLADQVKDACCPFGEYCEEPEGSNWKEWLEGGGPLRRSTSVTTANRHFVENFTALATWISREKKNGGRRFTPHIGWSEERTLYKFIEHMLKKSRTGVMPFSHAERLKGLDATWGQQRRTLAELFWSS